MHGARAGRARASPRCGTCQSGLSIEVPSGRLKRGFVAVPDIWKPPSCTSRWWAVQRRTRLSLQVSPPSAQCSMWCASTQRWLLHPGKRHPPSRATSARRSAGAIITRVPASSTVTMVALASQASRRIDSGPTGPARSRGPRLRANMLGLCNRSVDGLHHERRLVRVQARFEAHHAVFARPQRDPTALRIRALAGDLPDATTQRLELGRTRLLRLTSARENAKLIWGNSASALATRTFSRAATGPSPTRHDSHVAMDGSPWSRWRWPRSSSLMSASRRCSATSSWADKVATSASRSPLARVRGSMSDIAAECHICRPNSSHSHARARSFPLHQRSRCEAPI